MYTVNFCNMSVAYVEMSKDMFKAMENLRPCRGVTKDCNTWDTHD